MDESERQDILNTMDLLKRRFITINQVAIQEVKALIRAHGATYYDAPGEADELCALLVLKNKAWACLSEDMDMFVYGCPRVIRYLSLLKHTVVLYDLKEMLARLGMTQQQLREVCILSGTDYNTTQAQNMLHTTLRLFDTYQKQQSNIGFYDWLLKYDTKYIRDYDLLMKIYSMFDLASGHDNLQVFDDIFIMNSRVNHKQMREILKKEGFLFPV